MNRVSALVLATILITGCSQEEAVQTRKVESQDRIPTEAEKAEVANATGITDETELKNRFTITEAEVTIEKSGSSAQAPAGDWTASVGRSKNLTDNADILDDIADVGQNPYDLSKWAQVGKKAWKIIVDGKPVLNADTQTFSVLPESYERLGGWHKMENWSERPAAEKYKIRLKNLYGMSVVTQEYTIKFLYGGRVNGRGRFIANATVLPKVSVMWGFNLNSNLSVGRVVNTGTVADPIPGVELDVKWAVKTIVKEIQEVDSFYITGRGTVQHSNK